MAHEKIVSRLSYSASADVKQLRPRAAEPKVSLEPRARRQRERGRPRVPPDDYHNYCRYSSTHKGRDAPLLALPTEIRREIFRYLLPRSAHKFRLYTDCDSDIVGAKHKGRRPKYPDRYSLAILRTNRQIYFEALSVLYSENLFHFVGFNHLPVLEFIRRLNPDARELVRKVRLTLLTDPQGKQHDNHDLLCTVIHDYLPFLTTMRVDPRIWI